MLLVCMLVKVLSSDFRGSDLEVGVCVGNERFKTLNEVNATTEEQEVCGSSERSTRLVNNCPLPCRCCCLLRLLSQDEIEAHLTAIGERDM